MITCISHHMGLGCTQGKKEPTVVHMQLSVAYTVSTRLIQCNECLYVHALQPNNIFLLFQVFFQYNTVQRITCMHAYSIKLQFPSLLNLNENIGLQFLIILLLAAFMDCLPSPRGLPIPIQFKSLDPEFKKNIRSLTINQ